MNNNVVRQFKTKDFQLNNKQKELIEKMQCFIELGEKAAIENPILIHSAIPKNLFYNIETI